LRVLQGGGDGVAQAAPARKLIGPSIGRRRRALEPGNVGVQLQASAGWHYSAAVAFRALTPTEFEWITRPHEPEEPARHVAEPGTPLQSVNHGDEDLLVYAYGTPPETEHAELLESAV